MPHQRRQTSKVLVRHCNVNQVAAENVDGIEVCFWLRCKQLGHLLVVALDRMPQWSSKIAASLIDVRSCLEQHPRLLDARRHVQSRLAKISHRVGIGSSIEEHSSDLDRRRVEQRRARLRAALRIGICSMTQQELHHLEARCETQRSRVGSVCLIDSHVALLDEELDNVEVVGLDCFVQRCDWGSEIEVALGVDQQLNLVG